MAALVQYKSSNDAFATARTVTLDAAVTSGNSVIIGVRDGSGAVYTSVTDNQGNTYTLDYSVVYDTNLHSYYRAHNVTNAPTSFTVTRSEAFFHVIYVVEASGLADAAPSSTPQATNTTKSIAIDPTGADAVLLALGGSGGGVDYDTTHPAGVFVIAPNIADASSMMMLANPASDAEFTLQANVGAFGGAVSLAMVGAAYESAGSAGATLSLPTSASITQTTATIGCTSDTAAGLVHAGVTTTATPPSDAQLIAGSGGGIVAAGSVSAVAGANTVGLTGLTADTGYFRHFIQSDGASAATSTMLSPDDPTAGFTTLPIGPSVLASTSYRSAAAGAQSFSITPTASATAVFLMLEYTKDTGEDTARITGMQFNGTDSGTLVSRISSGNNDVAEVWKIDLTSTATANVTFTYTSAYGGPRVVVAAIAVDAYNSTTPLNLDQTFASYLLGTGGNKRYTVNLSEGEVAVDLIGNIDVSRTYTLDAVNSDATAVTGAANAEYGVSYIQGVTGLGEFAWDVSASGHSEMSSRVMVLNALVAAATIPPTITSVTPSTVWGTSTPVIAGSGFITQSLSGTSAIIVSPTNNVADGGAVAQTLTNAYSWSNTSIPMESVVFPAGTVSGSTVYLFVTNKNGDSNAAGYALTATIGPAIHTGTIVNPTTSGFDIRFTTDTANGTAYYVVYPTTSADPIDTQIVGQLDGDNVAALAAGNMPITTTGEQTFSSTVGLNPNVEYRVAVVHYSAA